MKKAQAKYSIAWSRDQLYCGHVTKPGRSRDQASRSRDQASRSRDFSHILHAPSYSVVLATEAAAGSIAAKIKY